MAEKRTIELEIQDNSKTLKQQYKEAVKELQNMVVAYGEMSDEAVNAAKRAAELKDQIEDTNDLMKTFKGEGAFVAMGKAMSSVASGFSAVEGGLALVGVESQKVQETLLRVQAAMALAQGLEGLEDAGRAFTVLGTKAKVALKGIKTELIATGIGAFVVAIGTVVAYWDDIKGAVSGVSAEQKKLNKDVDKQATASKDIYENAQLQENSLRLQGKSEKEILKIRINKLNTSIADEEARIKGLEETAKLENAAAQRNYEWMKMYIRFTLEGMLYVVRAIALPIDAVIAGANKVSEALGIGQVVATNLNEYISQGFDAAASWGAKLLFDPAQTKAESEATIKEAKKGLAQMKSDRDGFLLELKQSDKGSVNEHSKNEKEKLDLTRQRIDKEIEGMQDGYEKEKRILEEKAKREKEDLAESIKGKIYDQEEYAKTQKLIEDNLTKDLQKLEDEYYKGKLQARGFTIQSLVDDKKKEIEIEIAANQEKAANQKKFDEEEKERIKALNQDKLKLAKDGLQLVSDLADLFGQQNEKKAKIAFQVDKAAKISSATIAGYEAVLEAYKTGQKSPLTVAFPAYPYVQAGLAGAFAAVNIAKIAKSKFQSSGGGGGSMSPAGGGGGAAPMTANFNTIGSSGINQLAQLQQTPTQAYVVSGEVTSAQALDRNRVQNATL